jgi:hypothetical protein
MTSKPSLLYKCRTVFPTINDHVADWIHFIIRSIRSPENRRWGTAILEATKWVDESWPQVPVLTEVAQQNGVESRQGGYFLWVGYQKSMGESGFWVVFQLESDPAIEEKMALGPGRSPAIQRWTDVCWVIWQWFDSDMTVIWWRILDDFGEIHHESVVTSTWTPMIQMRKTMKHHCKFIDDSYRPYLKDP